MIELWRTEVMETPALIRGGFLTDNAGTSRLSSAEFASVGEVLYPTAFGHVAEW